MSTAANLTSIATIVSVNGEAFARGTDGSVRRLATGDSIYENEIVFTLANGQVELAFVDGHSATILGSESYQLTLETLAATQPVQGELAIAAAGETGKVVQTLAEGGDILEGLQAPAAGGAANNEGNTFVRLLRITEGVTPIGFEFPVNPTEAIRVPAGAAVLGQAAPPEEPENGYPIANPASAILDDEGLRGGIAGGIGDVAGEAASAAAVLPLPPWMPRQARWELKLSLSRGMTVPIP
jgi:hypothetical protein